MIMKLSLKNRSFNRASSAPPPPSAGLYNTLALKPPGLSNIASNCYANAILQCLMHSSSFLGLAEATISSHDSTTCFECISPGKMCISHLMEHFKAKYVYGSEVLDSRPIVNILQARNSTLVSGQQEDAHAFYARFIDYLVATSKDKERVFQACYFKEEQKLTCKACGLVSTEIKDSSILELYAHGRVSVHLQDLVTDSVPSSVTLPDVFCQRCGRKAACDKSESISYFPELFCAHVTKTPDKLNTASWYYNTSYILINNSLGSPNIQTQKAILKVRGKNTTATYKLVAVVVHKSLYFGMGHYIAFVRSRLDETQWFCLDDNKVQPVSVATALMQEPFMLFYELDPSQCKSSISLSEVTQLMTKEWLSDEITRQYMELVARTAAKVGKKVAVLDSQFYSKLCTKGYEGVKKWYRKTDFMAHNLLLCIVNLGNSHWTLLVVDIAEKKAEYYDSYKTDYMTSWDKIKAFLEARCRSEKKPVPDWSEWSYVQKQDQPSQSNGYDCGVFASQFALYRVFERKWDFTEAHMGVIRKVMLEELLSGSLIPPDVREQLLKAQKPPDFNYNPKRLLEPLAAAVHHKKLVPANGSLSKKTSTTSRTPSLSKTTTATSRASSLSETSTATSRTPSLSETSTATSRAPSLSETFTATSRTSSLSETSTATSRAPSLSETFTATSRTSSLSETSTATSRAPSLSETSTATSRTSSLSETSTATSRASSLSETSTATSRTSSLSETSTATSRAPSLSETSTATSRTSSLSETSTATSRASSLSETSTATSRAPSLSETFTATSRTSSLSETSTATSRASSLSETSTATSRTSSLSETSTATSRAPSLSETSTATSRTSSLSETSTATSRASSLSETSTATSRTSSLSETSTATSRVSSLSKTSTASRAPSLSETSTTFTAPSLTQISTTSRAPSFSETSTTSTVIKSNRIFPATLSQPATVLNSINNTPPISSASLSKKVSSSENVTLQSVPALRNITNISRVAPEIQNTTKPLFTAPSQPPTYQQAESTAKACKHCGKVYAHSSSLSKHLKKAHSEEKVETRNILCHLCDDRFQTILKLIAHLQGEHKENIQVEKLKFKDIQSFQIWKAGKEALVNTQYVQKCAPYHDTNHKIWYYYCNRSGQYQPQGRNVRHLKAQGTSKIGQQCTAHMKATLVHKSGRVKVEYCTTHNHSIPLAHLRMQHSTRMSIAAKLQQGVSMDRILDDIRDTVTNGMNREHLVTRKDLHNIKKQYNIEGIVRHANDLTSTSAWVEEMRGLRYNPILLFKKQGDQQPDDMDNVSEKDFLLGLQTEFQRDMFMKFGSKVVCVDSTHGTNSYDFYLTTLLVVDSYGEGIPVGWLISNREDTLVIMLFFEAIKKRAGKVIPQWFMSDMADQYFTAWVAIFGQNSTKKLICVWHVDKAWRKGLREHVKNKEKQTEVYHQLRTILMEPEESEFRVLLQDFLTHIQQDCPNFYTYFRDNYCNKIGEWATCFRVHATVNTNMFVESANRVLKVVYLHKKQNRRIDHLLTTLIRVARDKAFEQFQKLERGKNTHRICEINRRHKTAVSILEKNTHNIITVDPGREWRVESESQPGTYYTVAKEDQESCACQVTCYTCKICTHLYSCTCLDSILHYTVCKHVHLVAMTSTSENEQSGTRKEEDHMAYFSTIFTTDDDLSGLKHKLHAMVAELEVIISDCTDTDILQTVKTHLNSAITVSKATNEQSSQIKLPIKRQYAANSNHEQQARFFSTKKRKITSKQAIPKPSLSEMFAQKIKLKQKEPKFCGICMMENDSTNSDTIHWMQCVQCALWVHTNCAEHQSDPGQDYTCKYCNNE